MGVNDLLVMSGLDCDFNTYVHVLDPVLGLDFSGDNVNDTYFCKALSSLLLGDIESHEKVLPLTVLFSQLCYKIS